jgi:hypothetical protein
MQISFLKLMNINIYLKFIKIFYVDVSKFETLKYIRKVE